MFDSKLPISFYNKIASLNDEHNISIVQHRDTNKIYLCKEMSVYNLDVYETLFRNPVKNLPHIYAMYEEHNILTVIEEYISGDTLQEIFDICGPFSMADVISYTISLCDTLSVLHSMTPAIVHRDIKPSNVILTEDGRIILIDLNAAKFTNEFKDRDTRLIGTKGFAAPEQFGFGSSTPQTDIYALGVLMKTLLSDSVTNKKLSVIKNKCLELNPDDRFKSVIQLKTRLSKIKL